MSLSDKKIWLRDYDLKAVKEQVMDGKHDDCIVMWKEVQKAIEEFKDELCENVDFVQNKETKFIAYYSGEGIVKILNKVFEKRLTHKTKIQKAVKK